MIKIYDAVDMYLDERMTIGTLSDASVYNRRYELKRFANFCKDENIILTDDITKKTLIDYLKTLNISKASINNILFVLTSFFDYMVDESFILDNLAANIHKPKIYKPKTDYLALDELDQLFQSEANNRHKKVIDRNLLLFSLFVDLCLRVTEVINLKINDVRIDLKELWVTRKQGKIEKMPISDDIAGKFLNWYEIRPQYKGSDLEWIFLSSHGKQLTRRQVHYIVSQALKRAGLLKRKQGPHLLRHSGASLKAQAGENIIMIQYLLGHENLNTTRRYLHFQWEELKGMVDRSSKMMTEKRNEAVNEDSDRSASGA